ncbi:T9SS type A sorting domain-containing protein [Hymenobacter sp. 15J16-1T3B]|uniref:LamG-like jellyroll fold domain-containing protein n=1 Tax=Hymenobacter sp. 15J16-1T3B TaxID=2886941 RepID=UPI001D10E7FB|nr:LamG-like jellyroll fold domain-containing protein [Hymenobacter sp. 15J16-1T3B]MCC3160648.1 T9SS type A sorting domain-containing protein [Hymenobacter sp. 15J16-1T3B]
MTTITRLLLRSLALGAAVALQLAAAPTAEAQTLAFPGAGGFGRFATGARGAATRSVYVVTNLNDSGPGSFREAVSQPGRVVTFAVGGIIRLQSNVQVAPNVLIAGQTAPGDGIVLFNKRVTFTGASNTIARFLRIRLGATDNQGNDASGLANGSDIILDHMSFSWGMDEVFSINWDGKGQMPDNITVQNSIIGQGLHKVNHSAGGLIQTPDGGKVSLLQNLYISNKTRNPKVKGINEFVNNVVYDWGNGNRLGNQLNYGWSGDAYIMGGSAGVSEVNIINNYFVGGPLTPPSKTTPFSRGTGTFYLYGAGNYFDNDRDGQLNGTLVPYDTVGYPGIVGAGFRSQPFAYPAASPQMTAAQAYQHVIDSAGACYPRRDQVDGQMIAEVRSRGTQGYYVYNESDLPFANGGLGEVFSAPAPTDTDQDGLPDAWESSHGLNPTNPADAVAFSSAQPQYLNIEVYVNSLIKTPAPAFVKPPTDLQLQATSAELPAPSSTVALSWTDNATTETGFVLERSTDGVTYAAIAQPAADATSYTDQAGLLPNTTYYYRLKALTPTGASAYSTPASVRTPALPSAPAVPAAPTPTDGQPYADLTAGGLQLKWTGSANTTTFSVYVGTAAGTLTKRADVAYSAAPSYTLSGLADNTTYFWRIDAVNSKGTTEGPVWSFRTTGSVVPELVGYWAFDETQADGLQILDQSSYQNHGVLGLDDDDQSIRVAGKVAGALNFATADPTRYVVRIPHQDQLYLDRNSFSLAFWMKADPATLPQTNNQSAYLLCKGSITRNAATGATGKRFDIEFKNRQLRFAIDDDVNKDELQTDGTVFYSGQWVHVVAIRDYAGKKLQLYLNGALVKEISTKALGIGETSALIIGNIGELEFASTANAPAPYTGQLDELKLFNYVLTAQDIIKLRHAGPLPLQAYNPSLAPNALVEGFGDVRVNWQGGYQTDAYKLYLGTAANALNYVGDVSVTDAAAALSGLAANTSYFWRVDAVNALGTTAGETWAFRTGNPRGLVAHYQLDETGGLVAHDHSNYHQDGTLTGLPTSSWNPAGKLAGSLLFGPSSASTGAVVVPSAPQLLFDQNAFTVALWARIPANTYTSSNAKDCYLLQKGTFEATTGKWYGLQLRDGVLTFGIDDGVTKTDVAFRVSAAPTNLFNDQWQHIVAIRDVDSKTLKLYLNGTLVASKTYTTLGIGKGDALLLGNSAENKPFRDQLDDVRLYNYALSEAEIGQLVAGAPLVAKASNPSPADGAAAVPYGAIPLTWTGAAQTYNVFAGASPASLAPAATGLTSPAFTATAAQLGARYWRVDAVRDGETATGDVWRFTVVDTVRPTVVTKNLTVTLVNGAATITAADVDNHSFDDFGLASLTLSRSSFDCSTLGAQQVILTATDPSGNTASAPATVTVIGAVPAPAIALSRSDNTFTGGDAATLFLGYGAQQLTLTASNATGAASYQWSPATDLSSATAANPTFAPTAAGTYTFVVTATNEFGCAATASVTLTVLDVRSGPHGDKVTLCHNGGALSVAHSAVPAHLQHGCALGSCATASRGTAAAPAPAARTAAPSQPVFSVYPTVVSDGQLRYAFAGAPEQAGQLELLTLTGKRVVSQPVTATEAGQLPLRGLQAGTYLVRLTTATGSYTSRVVVQ